MSCAAWVAVVLLALPVASRGEEGVDSPEADRADAVAEPSTERRAEPLDAIPEGAVVGRLDIRVGDVFDTTIPKESHWFYRLANRLHRKTRRQVIRRHLLFRSGDPYRPIRIEESERLLRAEPYLYDVEIRPVDVHDGVVDMAVLTRDVWTLEGGVRFGREGGKSSLALHLADDNLLGTGMGVEVEHRTDVDRTSNVLSFSSSRILDGRTRFETSIDRSDDGGGWSLGVERPFESLDTRWAAGSRLAQTDRVDTIYSLGRVVDRFRHRTSSYGLSGGWSSGIRTRESGTPRVLRWRLGLTYRQDRFEAVEISPQNPLESIGPLPDDRTLVYPWVGAELLVGAYSTTRDQSQMDRTEDLFLGRRLQMRLGYASPALGSDHAAAIFDIDAGLGRELSERQTVVAEGGLTGRWGSGGSENLVGRAAGSFYQRDLGHHLLAVAVEGAVARHLDPENQLLLGGDSGLRGYPLRYQSGEAKLLLTVEQRVFTNWYPFRLFHVAAAAFFDAGRTWGAGVPGEPDLGLLRDLGVGLRLAPSRSAKTILHLDIAFPLDGDPSIRGVQWLVKSKTSL